MELIKMYGIPNCDTVKKVANWFKQHKIEYSFHNFKTEGITKAKLNEWASKADWNLILNKKSTTWRALAPNLPDKELTRKEALLLLFEHTSLIKRPIIEYQDQISIGFDESLFQQRYLSTKK